MKALEWINFFAEQRASHAKVVFSVAELANAARTTLHALNTELGRLVRRGLITRYAHGRYGLVRGVAPEDILPEVDPGAYVTGFYALFRHHLVNQVPTEVTCFTDRRHNRRADRATPAGKLRFIRVPVAVYAKPAGQVLVSAEQALCDFVWLNLRSGVEPRSLVTFRNLNVLSQPKLKKILRRYPEKVQNSVGGMSSLAKSRSRAR
ncbi:MAG TPA: hypothetical protein VJA21_23335 [Verrucomicrobiae bacterium]